MALTTRPKLNKSHQAIFPPSRFGLANQYEFPSSWTEAACKGMKPDSDMTLVSGIADIESFCVCFI